MPLSKKNNMMLWWRGCAVSTINNRIVDVFKFFNLFHIFSKATVDNYYLNPFYNEYAL